MTIVLVASAFFSQALLGQDNKRTAYTDPQKVGPDFAVQGEYSGKLTTDEGDAKYGVQVIARGNGKFHAVAYPGGLPGDGWTGAEKIEADGKRDGAVTRFATEKASAVIEDGVLTVRDSDGNKLGDLKKVTRKSPTLGKKPPKGAVVLFDGTSADAFKNGRMTDDGLLKQGVTSKQTFQSGRLHLEFQLSFMPYARGQGRSNSGCYLQGRYEVQILDSFGLSGKNNEAGGIYEISDPELNMCYPPLAWQTYDIEFTAAKYDENGKKTASARMTVRHNGVLVQDDVEVPRATRGSRLKEGPQPGPLYLQDHGNPVRFRNIWFVHADDSADSSN